MVEVEGRDASVVPARYALTARFGDEDSLDPLLASTHGFAYTSLAAPARFSLTV